MLLIKRIMLLCALGFFSGCEKLSNVSLNDNVNNGAVLGAVAGAVGGYCISQVITDNIFITGLAVAAGASAAGVVGQQWAKQDAAEAIITAK